MIPEEHSSHKKKSLSTKQHYIELEIRLEKADLKIENLEVERRELATENRRLYQEKEGLYREKEVLLKENSILREKLARIEGARIKEDSSSRDDDLSTLLKK